jgi:type II secretory pathway pseudopilin PulG
MDRGFSLVEALFATTILTIGIGAVSQLALVAVRANHDAASTTRTTVLASQKMEQLRALAWTFDASGATLSDTSTDTAVTPERPAGGTGLRPSGPDVLAQNTTGYCDFLDATGRIVGGGTRAPASATFVRRWSIEQVSAATDVLVIQVLAMPTATSGATSSGPRRPGEVRLVQIKGRKAR